MWFSAAVAQLLQGSTCCVFTFTFMHLADAFIQSDLQCIQAIIIVVLSVFPGN